jgi:hypothetical protein
MVGAPHQSLIEKPSWVRAPRTSQRELARIRSAREADLAESIAALVAQGGNPAAERQRILLEVVARHPETGWEYWLLRGCEHAKALCEWPTRETEAIEATWSDISLKMFLASAADRMWTPLRMAKVAKALGFEEGGDRPALMACPKCAETLFADRVRPILTELGTGRWQIAASGGCTHIPDSEKSRADTPQELADRWNAWANKKLEDRLATADLADGVKGSFAAAVAAR